MRRYMVKELAISIVRSLREEGFEAYFAGGCVRDLLLGREPADYDVATSATPDIVLKLFPRTFAVGAHFGVVLVADKTIDEPPPREDAPVAAPRFSVTEVATFRSDGAYSDGRHPDGVRYTTSAREDVQRRDFTINGLLLDPTAFGGVAEENFPSAVRAGLHDYVGGLADLESGVIRAIGDPARRFQEDRLRLL